MPENRRDQYAKFLRALSKLFAYALARDIVFKGHEWWRSFEKAAEYAAKGVGSKNSMHCYSLALDIYIVNKTGKGVLLGKTPKETEPYRILGEYWEKTLGMVWGPTVRPGDIFHFQYKGRPL